jgi:hypothetical protein
VRFVAFVASTAKDLYELQSAAALRPLPYSVRLFSGDYARYSEGINDASKFAEAFLTSPSKLGSAIECMHAVGVNRVLELTMQLVTAADMHLHWPCSLACTSQVEHASHAAAARMTQSVKGACSWPCACTGRWI